jgi:hypothetical protein
MLRVDNGNTSVRANRIFNAYIERFNCTFRKEVLNLYLFDVLDAVHSVTSPWLQKTQ